ncbi:MAG: hypothetical protein AAGM22_29550 [Acidobacteriota bacterium]
MPDKIPCSRRRLIPAVLLAAALSITGTAPTLANDGVLRDGAILQTVEGPDGLLIHKIHRTPRPAVLKSGGLPSFDGDSFSFSHELAALIDGVFQCFKEHQSGMDDNTVLFDGLSELLDPYTDGTQPLVFEFESPDTNNDPPTQNVFMNSFTESGGDLFPDGFQDPQTNTPLDSACIKIGIDDTLDSDVPSTIEEAMFEGSNSQGSVIPPTDITQFFENPFDGDVTIVFQGMAGMDIDGTILDIKAQNFDGNPIFSDGFESGDTTAWTDEFP